MKRILWIFLIISSSISSADQTEVMIPGKNWGISFDMPTISHYKGQATNRGFQYMAASAKVSGATSTMLSFFLEDDYSGSNKECFEGYWSRTKKNPIIIPSSVKTESLDGYEQVYYKYSFGQPQANFYFVNQGYCIDVHVSLSDEIKGAEETLLAIGKSLKIVTLK